LTETWLDADFGDKELGLGLGGGVLIAIKSCFPCTRKVNLEVDAEMLACE